MLNYQSLVLRILVVYVFSVRIAKERNAEGVIRLGKFEGFVFEVLQLGTQYLDMVVLLARDAFTVDRSKSILV